MSPLEMIFQSFKKTNNYLKQTNRKFCNAAFYAFCSLSRPVDALGRFFGVRRLDGLWAEAVGRLSIRRVCTQDICRTSVRMSLSYIVYVCMCTVYVSAYNMCAVYVCK